MNTNLINIALAEYGIKEIPGSNHNPRILEYFKEIGRAWVSDDETAWCSAFANYVAKTAGFEFSGELNARSWIDCGCETNKPEIGDVVVFWREDPRSWKGHVAFFIRETKDLVYVLGGNQSNQVCIKAYPKARLLQYRRLRKLVSE